MNGRKLFWWHNTITITIQFYICTEHIFITVLRLISPTEQHLKPFLFIQPGLSGPQMPIPFAWWDLISDCTPTPIHSHTYNAIGSSSLPSTRVWQMEKSPWLVEVSAFRGVFFFFKARSSALIFSHATRYGNVRSVMAAYWTINFHLDMTSEDIEVAWV